MTDCFIFDYYYLFIYFCVCIMRASGGVDFSGGLMLSYSDLIGRYVLLYCI